MSKTEGIKRKLRDIYWWDQIPKGGQKLIELAVDLAYSQGKIDEGTRILKDLKKSRR